jgi:hypothetical protein
MALRSPLHSKKQAAPGYMLLFILTFAFLALITVQGTERRAEPISGMTASTHEVGVPLFGTLAGG